MPQLAVTSLPRMVRPACTIFARGSLVPGNFSQRVTEKASAAFSQADQFAQHLNTYRAVSHWFSRNSGHGRAFARRTEWSNKLLADFDTYDQDKDRVDWARKLQLSQCCPVFSADLRRAMAFAENTQITNLAVLHQLAKTRLKIFGDKQPKEALSYARRAAAKLHPDRTQDLDGWSIPGTRYSRHKPSGYRYEHAKHGAAALFALHNGMKALLEQPHYAKQLYSSRVLRGGELTVCQLLSDTTAATLLGAVIAAVRGKALAGILYASGLAYAVLLSALACRAIASAVKKRSEVQCRELVVYRPNFATLGEAQ